MSDLHHRPADPAFVPALGGFERAIDMMETLRGAGHIVRVITFEGAMEPGLFEQALRNLVQRRPILNTRVVRPQEEAPYFARSDQSPAISIVERRDEEHWRAEFDGHLSTPLSVAGDDTLLRLTVLVGDSRGEIVLSCHHAVCDGRSLTAFCRDLVHEYQWLLRGAPGVPAAAVGAIGPPLEELLPPGLTDPEGAELLERFGARFRDLLSSPPGLVLDLPHVPPAPPGRHVLTYELPHASAEALVSRARANGTTIGGAMSAAVLRAGLDIGASEAEDTVGLSSNIDLRPHLRENVPLSDMGSYASSSSNVYAGARTKPFWTLAREVTQTVQSSIDSLGRVLHGHPVGAGLQGLRARAWRHEELAAIHAARTWDAWIFPSLARTSVSAASMAVHPCTESCRSSSAAPSGWTTPSRST